ncbi:MAG: InlB B-repeat-containing protein [Clostridia bacterium]|nr:InlB B-repeat-containing protein [Clostridia bacterium]
MNRIINKKTIFKISILIALCIGVCAILVSCRPVSNNNSSNNGVYTVTFMVDGATYMSDPIYNGVIAKPYKDPVKTNYDFICWSTEEGKNVPFDFSTKVNSSVTLYGYFVFDSEGIAEEVAKVENSIVKVTNTYKENGETKTKEGIGVTYHVQGGYCYIVTTCHTVMILENQTDSKVIVTDVEGNEFEAKVFKGKNKPAPAIDAEYDLAVICFEYTGNVIKKNEYVNVLDYLGETVISVGADKDDVAVGEFRDYKKIKFDFDENLSNIDFEVYCHTSIPESKAKETLTYNTDMHLIGLTYYTEDGIAYSIPTGRIAQFLNIYLYG